MPESDDHPPATEPDVLAGEGGAGIGGEPDGAAPALDQRPGESGEAAGGGGGLPGAAMRRFGRRLYIGAALAFLLNLAVWGGEWAGWVPHAYPDVPIAIACILLMWTARGLQIQGRNRAAQADSTS